MRTSLRRRFAGTPVGLHARFPEGQPVAGLEDGPGDWPKITCRRLERGYEPVGVQKIIGGKRMRVFERAWRSDGQAITVLPP